MSTERLPCNLNDGERVERARASTELLAEYSSKEAHAKSAAATARAELKTLRTSLEEAARAAREGWEYQEVEVIERPSGGLRRMMDTVRMDTGEVIRSRAMTEEELRRFVQPRLVD